MTVKEKISPDWRYPYERMDRCYHHCDPPRTHPYHSIPSSETQHIHHPYPCGSDALEKDVDLLRRHNTQEHEQIRESNQAQDKQLSDLQVKVALMKTEKP